MATYKNVERYGPTNLGVRTLDPSTRRNNKRPCQYCKVTFPSQRTYNAHVNTCTEIPIRRTNVVPSRVRPVHQGNFKTTETAQPQRKQQFHHERNQGNSDIRKRSTANQGTHGRAQASVGN